MQMAGTQTMTNLKIRTRDSIALKKKNNAKYPGHISIVLSNYLIINDNIHTLSSFFEELDLILNFHNKV